MRALLNVMDKAVGRVIGTVEAGACHPENGCCCRAGTTYAINCLGNCVVEPSCSKGRNCQ